MPSACRAVALWITSAYLTLCIAATEKSSIVQSVIDAAGAHVFHLDLHARTRESEGAAGTGFGEAWFKGFQVEKAGPQVTAAAATVSHPIRRMLSFLRSEGVEIEEAWSWLENEGTAGYQAVDNFMVRVLAGRPAWELPPGRVGKSELHAARVALGKFEVLMREECLSADLQLLEPYLERDADADVDARQAASENRDPSDQAQDYFLTPSTMAESLVRLNRWDLQLWEFAQQLILSRSVTLDSFLCNWRKPEAVKRAPGAGRRAVVYNSPNFHSTGVSMFSCILMSWGFDVTAVVKNPQDGYEQLLPCPHRTISLVDALVVGDDYIVVNSTVLDALGVTPETSALGQEDSVDNTPEHVTKASQDGGARGRSLTDLEIVRPGAGGDGIFDVSVLCTLYTDLEVLFSERHPMDPRLVNALLWDVKVSIWNIHSVTRALANDTVPVGARKFAMRMPSTDGRVPPPTFLTLYGEHVKSWATWLAEAYGGWETTGDDASSKASKAQNQRESRGSNLGELLSNPGVVYPIHPTGHMRLPRPSGRLAHGGEVEGEAREPMKFVVQGKLEGVRRDYKKLFSCLESMCLSGRADFLLDAVGSGGDLHDEREAYPCTNERYSEGRDLGYEEFYARISAGDFVVTASAGHHYEYDRATSSVPTALLLERPLVMASSLVDAYPCLRNSRIHRMVANDDLCRNLHAAYDLSHSQYDEMELEARDCKLQMWQKARETVAGIVSS